MIRFFKLFIFFSFINFVDGQSEYIYILGNVQDAGIPHIGCEHEFCNNKFNEFEEYFTTSIAVIDPLNKKYVLFEMVNMVGQKNKIPVEFDQMEQLVKDAQLA